MKSNELKASDLRIGNYLQDREGRLCIVTAVTKETDPLSNEDFKAPTLKGPVTSLPHSPIPLTEEILVRLGFTVKENLWFECAYFSEQDADDTNIICINLSSGRCCLTTEYREHYVYAAKEIRCLHQLQNLYFALTGEELTLKER